MKLEETRAFEAAPLVDQASHWWVLLHSETVSAADRREFREWVGRSPERIAAFLQMARMMRGLKERDFPWPETPVEILIRDARAAPADVIQLNAQAVEVSVSVRPRRPPAFNLKLAGLAAVLLAAVAGSWAVLLGPKTYRTDLGEQRSVLLEDGSLVTLNTSSRIKVEIVKEHRTVRLLQGEALFQVAHDRNRPFDVIAGQANVRAVGTQFNVDLRASNTTVTVVEGRVAVSSAQSDARPGSNAPVFVSAAERVVITPTAVSAPERVVNLAAAAAWAQRKLVFERRPLGEVIAEFNRYNHQRIEIDSLTLRERKVTGTFEANDADSFVTFLSQSPGVIVRKTDDGTSIVSLSGEGVPR